MDILKKQEIYDIIVLELNESFTIPPTFLSKKKKADRIHYPKCYAQFIFVLEEYVSKHEIEGTSIKHKYPPTTTSSFKQPRTQEETNEQQYEMSTDEVPEFMHTISDET